MAKRRGNVHKNHQDEFSKLPNDILISIISRLTFQEAIATSILSTRWRRLHSYLAHLDFPSFSYSHYPRVPDLMIERLSNYENSINHFLDSHRGIRIKEFKVDLSDLKGPNFEKWFEFGLTKEAEIIHISMLHKGQIFRRINPILLRGLKCLGELFLSMIDVTDEDFEILVSNCLALESLSIKSPKNLKKVSIVGHSKLKHLDLSHVWAVRSIEIRDVINLVSLKFYELSLKCVVQLNNIPKLIKLDFGEDYYGLPHAALFANMPSSIRDQLQLLHLLYFHIQVLPFQFVNVKHLELVFDMSTYLYDSLLEPLIEACRSLEKLVIKFLWTMSDTQFDKVEAKNIIPTRVRWLLNI